MFEAIGEGHKIMAEGPKKEIDLDELERMLKKKPLCTDDIMYLLCALPGLIAENRELRARGQELERQREWLAKFVASYVDCNQCPYSEDVCTPQAHVDCCSLISQKAEEATKEAGDD